MRFQGLSVTGIRSIFYDSGAAGLSGKFSGLVMVTHADGLCSTGPPPKLWIKTVRESTKLTCAWPSFLFFVHTEQRRPHYGSQDTAVLRSVDDILLRSLRWDWPFQRGETHDGRGVQ